MPLDTLGYFGTGWTRWRHVVVSLKLDQRGASILATYFDFPLSPGQYRLVISPLELLIFEQGVRASFLPVGIQQPWPVALLRLGFQSPLKKGDPRARTVAEAAEFIRLRSRGRAAEIVPPCPGPRPSDGFRLLWMDKGASLPRAAKSRGKRRPRASAGTEHGQTETGVVIDV